MLSCYKLLLGHIIVLNFAKYPKKLKKIIYIKNNIVKKVTKILLIYSFVEIWLTIMRFH